MYEVNRKLLQEHAAPLMAVYLHGVAVVRQELNMDVGRKSITGAAGLRPPVFQLENAYLPFPGCCSRLA